MTRPSKPIHLTSAIVDRFAAYHRRERVWGIFHVPLEDGNFKVGAADPRTDEEHALHAMFALMSPSQRAKLARKA